MYHTYERTDLLHVAPEGDGTHDRPHFIEVILAFLAQRCIEFTDLVAGQ